MRASNDGEAAASRGGLRARFGHLLANAALVRLTTLVVGLTTLGFMGQCFSPARASAPDVPVPSPDRSSVVDASLTNLPAPIASANTNANPHANDADAGAGTPTPSLVELNTATIDDLRRLPGIGPRRATAILELRAKLGGFRKLEDLMRVRGLGRGAMKRLRPLVTVGARSSP